MFLTFAENNGLLNIIKEPTGNKNILDPFMTSIGNMFQLSNTIINKEIATLI